MSNEEAVKKAVEEAKAESQSQVEVEESIGASADEGKQVDESQNVEDVKQVEEGKKEKKVKKSKKDKKDLKIEELEATVCELKDKDLRRMAEFENFRKRTDKEKLHMYTVGAKEVVEKILPIIDSFERGLNGADESDAFAAGMNLIYKQFVKALDEMGVKEIPTDGEEFNPDLHNAVMHEDNPDVGENIIVETFQKGYTYKDEIVRYAMVKVAN